MIGALEKRRWLSGISLLALLCILLGMVAPQGRFPLPKGFLEQNATIKTQEAADSVPGGIRGIDVSVYQGTIEWAKVAQTDVEFAIVRASYGTATDKNFYTNVNGASQNGLYVGAYHYAKFTDRTTMQQEARYFINVMDPVKDKLTYPVVLDLENNRGRLTRQQLTDYAKEFVDIVRGAGYTDVYIYSYNNYFRDFFMSSQLSGYDLWVAHYSQEPNYNQKMWQYTSQGRVNGISGNVDMNIAYSNLATSGRRLMVSRTISNSIKETLNARHNSGLNTDGLDMAEMKFAVVTAMQSELNRQLDAGVSVTGVMDAPTLDALEQVGFTLNETSGNMTYLLQVMLFYKGHYTEPLSATYDMHMYQALQQFQREMEIEVTGQLDRSSLWYLLR